MRSAVTILETLDVQTHSILRPNESARSVLQKTNALRARHPETPAKSTLVSDIHTLLVRARDDGPESAVWEGAGSMRMCCALLPAASKYVDPGQNALMLLDELEEATSMVYLLRETGYIEKGWRAVLEKVDHSKKYQPGMVAGSGMVLLDDGNRVLWSEANAGGACKVATLVKNQFWEG